MRGLIVLLAIAHCTVAAIENELPNLKFALQPNDERAVGIESARQTLALYDYMCSGPKDAAFRDLSAIYERRLPDSMDIPGSYRNREPEALADVTPIVKSASGEDISYSMALASIAEEILMMLNPSLLSNLKPLEQVSNSPEIRRVPYGDSFFMKEFASRYCNILKSLDKAVYPKGIANSEFPSVFDQNAINIYTWREVTLRALNCLLVVSTAANGTGNKVFKEILKDEDVLEIIKQHFSISYDMKTEMDKEFHRTFANFLKYNDRNRGISKILLEFSAADQCDVLIRATQSSAKSFIKYFKSPQYATQFRGTPQSLNFIFKFLAIEKAIVHLVQPSEQIMPIARSLIQLVGRPTKKELRILQKSGWSFLYYVYESLASAENTAFRKSFNAELTEWAMLQKIELLNKNFDIRKMLKVLLPKQLELEPRSEIEVWKRLADKMVKDTFDDYFVNLELLGENLKVHRETLEMHLKNYHRQKRRAIKTRNQDKLISAEIGYWVKLDLISYPHHGLPIPLLADLKKFARSKHTPVIREAFQLKQQSLPPRSKRTKV